MAEREVIVLNEGTPRLEVPQSGDTYYMPRALRITGGFNPEGSGANSVVVGGGTTATGLRSMALGYSISESADDTTAIGAGNVKVLQLDQDATAGNTRLLIWDVDTGALARVSVGANDSGGTGYKYLRIPN